MIAAHAAFLGALAAGSFAADTSPTSALPLTFAPGGSTWRAVTEGGGQVAWATGGAGPSVTLRPNGGYAGIAAPVSDQPLNGLLDAELVAAGDGNAELQVACSAAGDAAPLTSTWSFKRSGGKPQRLAARLAPVLQRNGPVYLHIGARGDGTLQLSELSLSPEDVLPPVDASSVEATLPPNWQPNGTLDATSRQMGEETDLAVEVRGVQFSVLPEASGTLGYLAPITALVVSQGEAEKSISITGEFPDGVAIEPREAPITKAQVDRATVRLQGLLPGRYTGKLIVSSGRDSAALPLTMTVAPGFPAFGTTTTEGNQVAGRWQLREIRVRASPTSTVEELVQQVAPLLEGAPAIPVVYLDGAPSVAVLKGFVIALKGKVALYGPAHRADRPFQGEDPREQAEALVAAARALHTAVSAGDYDAYVASPVFDYTAGVAGSGENKLLEACLTAGLGRFFRAFVVTAAPLPAGGVLGESVNGRNQRDASPFWAGLDRTCDHSALAAMLYRHSVEVPILTSGVTGLASTDEQLDALKAARAMAISAYAGATGVTFPEAPAAGEIALLRADGTLSATGVAAKQLSRELASAAPVRRSWKGLPGTLGEPIVALPFVRDTEAIIAFWNNTSVARRVTLELGAVPYTQHTLTLSRGTPFVSRAYDPHFRFSKAAIQAKRQEVCVRLAPLQITVLRFRLQIWTPTWLQSLTFTVERHPAAPTGEHDDRPWWKKLQDWAEGNDSG